MKTWLREHFFSATGAFVRLFQQPFATLFTILMLGIAITLPMTLYLGMQSMDSLFGHLSSKPKITVYMDLAADRADADVINQMLRERQIGKVQFISKEIALQRMHNNPAMADVISLLEDNPLPDAFTITPNDSTQSEALAQELSGLPMVESVQQNSRWLNALFEIRQVAHHILFLLTIILAIVFVLVAYNTINLQTLVYRDEIAIQRLLGASGGFIRRPFMYISLWQALLALGVGMMLCYFLFIKISQQAATVLATYDIVWEQRFFHASEIILITFSVAVFAMFGAALAVWHHLRNYQAISYNH